MSGYTPGPWVYTNDPYDDGTPYMRLYAGEDSKPDASDGFSITGIVHPNDAHLIAAAPDLLEACHAFECGQSDFPLLVRAAIAKATGVKP